MKINKERGISILEILIAASLFTISILGISQVVTLMYRYAMDSLCKTQAHLYATSYFEQLLCNTHPYDLFDGNVTLRDIHNPNNTVTFAGYFLKSHDTIHSVTGAENTDIFSTSLDVAGRQMDVRLRLMVDNSPLYDDYGTATRTEINPPEGFQSLRFKYQWTSPLGIGTGDLYAIRPMQPDDPDLNTK